jgi:hypothetical protein
VGWGGGGKEKKLEKEDALPERMSVPWEETRVSH